MAVTLATPARVMVSNALAAAAAGVVMGVPVELIQAGLESFTPPLGRMGVRPLGRDMVLVDDTYNANPASMAAAMEMLARMHPHRRKIAILGEMLELGPESADLHRQIGRIAAETPMDRLYLTGNFAAAVADGAMDRSMAADRIFCGTKAAIIERLYQELQAGDLILVKGSRGMAMEAVVEAIVGWTKQR
jgi:UDP-N-acetylmuramoyl-tripeptide--D-alanyl-D-alanine ligase